MFGVGSGDRVICGSNEALFTAALQHLEAEHALCPRERIIYASVSLLLILVGGICAGLTLGLLSLSPLDLEMIKRTATSQKEKLMALKVERVSRNPHQLLVCLLVVNAACMEILPLVLDRLLNPIAAIIISVSAILIFSEVVPQAVCKKYGLQIGASLAWLVHIMLFITWPVSYPIGKLLDWSLGNHGKAFFRRAELKEFVTLHGEAPEEEGATESVLTTEECQVIHGALDMANKTAETAMTPLEKVFSISADAPFDQTLLRQIIEAGHSRVPVYDVEDVSNIIGLILVKELLMHEPNGSLKIGDCNIREIDFLVADTPLYSVMQLFQMKRRHMAVIIKGRGSSRNFIVDPRFSSGGLGRIGEEVGQQLEEERGEENFEYFGETLGENHRDFGDSASFGVLESATAEVIGIITAEDVLEELLQTEWQDETDRYLDNRFEVRVSPTPRNSELPPGLLRYVVAQRHQHQHQYQYSYQQQQQQTIRRRGETLMGFGKGVSRQSSLRSGGGSVSVPALVSPSTGGGGGGGSVLRQQPRVQKQHLAGETPTGDEENAPLLDV